MDTAIAAAVAAAAAAAAAAASAAATYIALLLLQQQQQKQAAAGAATGAAPPKPTSIGLLLSREPLPVGHGNVQLPLRRGAVVVVDTVEEPATTHTCGLSWMAPANYIHANATSHENRSPLSSWGDKISCTAGSRCSIAAASGPCGGGPAPVNVICGCEKDEDAAAAAAASGKFPAISVAYSPCRTATHAPQVNNIHIHARTYTKAVLFAGTPRRSRAMLLRLCARLRLQRARSPNPWRKPQRYAGVVTAVGDLTPLLNNETPHIPQQYHAHYV